MNGSRVVLRFLTYFFVSTFLLLELAVRALHLAPELRRTGEYVSDPFLPYRPRPFSVSEGRSSGEFSVIYNHNSLGFRDVERPLEPSPGVFRILGLGDSFTYGAGAPFESTYLYRLEELLNARGQNHARVDIVKAGVPGYSPTWEKVLLEKYGLKFAPLLVMVAILPNDVVDESFGGGALHASERGYLLSREALSLGRPGELAHLHSHAVRALLPLFLSLVRGPSITDPYVPSSPWIKVEEKLTEMNRLSKEANAKFVVVHIPQKGPWNEAASYPVRRLGEWAARNGALFLDTLPALRAAAAQGPLYWAQDGHCNSAGYEVIAGVIFAGLLEAGYVP